MDVDIPQHSALSARESWFLTCVVPYVTSTCVHALPRVTLRVYSVVRKKGRGARRKNAAAPGEASPRRLYLHPCYGCHTLEMGSDETVQEQ
jgi:hypothetical protein